MVPSAILLFAAGLGTRMAPLTDTRPKPLVEVGGKTLLDHALDQCEGLRIVVNAHYFADQISAHLSGHALADRILVSDERDTLLETGGGLKKALPLLNGNPVMTMNTDAVWRGPRVIDALRSGWHPDMQALLLMIPRDKAVGHTGSGDFDVLPDGRLIKGSGYVYSGVQIIRTDALADITEEAFSMWALWTEMLKQGTMFGTTYEGQWCDVGRPDSIPVAEKMLAGDLDV